MTIRKAVKVDIDALMNLFDQARATIAALGIDQWQNGYPNPIVVSEDIAFERAYIVGEEDGLWGTFVIVDDGEPTYDRIFDGHWLTGDDNKNYLALHRVAVDVEMRGKGVSTAIVNYALECAKASGRDSVRIDTHRGNVVMRRMLEKHGFKECGIIYLLWGAPRVAYELVL